MPSEVTAEELKPRMAWLYPKERRASDEQWSYRYAAEARRRAHLNPQPYKGATDGLLPEE